MWRKVGCVPRWLTPELELGYLACFPLVPISFAAVWTAGSPADVARYWLAVLVAGYACYITLPWLVSRPPRLIEESCVDVALTDITRLNRFVLGRVSHRLNTFPSGHVAVSVAAAISVGKVWPAAGVVLGAVAAAVAVDAVAGRYHYVADARPRDRGLDNLRVRWIVELGRSIRRSGQAYVAWWNCPHDCP